MLFTCKNVMFYNFTWKNFFAPQNGVEGGGGGEGG